MAEKVHNITELPNSGGVAQRPAGGEGCSPSTGTTERAEGHLKGGTRERLGCAKHGRYGSGPLAEVR